MSNLEELIERLCPDGVEYKTLGDVATISRGGNFQKKDFTEQGKPCIHYGQIYTRYGLFTDKTLTFINDECFAKQKYAEPNDIIMAVTSENIEDICKCVAWLGTEKVAVSGHSAIIHHSLDPKYLAYFFHSQHFFNQKRKLAHGTKVMEVTPDTLKSIQLPVPPLEVQREIVRILDNFTFLTTELAAELAARQKQYEYYRNLLFLSLKAEYRFIPEFAKTYIGLVTTMTQHYVKEGVKLLFNSSVKENHFDFPKMVYLDNEFAEKNSSRMHKLGDIITVHTGDVGTSAIIDETLEGSLGFATIVTRIYNQEDVLPKYVSYYLNSNENKNNIYKLIKGDRNNLNLKDFNKLRVPIPSLEQQQRIVDILDRFDTLCNDITSGLPAEIEMRQKQYEYYRDKLLTFKELKKEA